MWFHYANVSMHTSHLYRTLHTNWKWLLCPGWNTLYNTVMWMNMPFSIWHTYKRRKMPSTHIRNSLCLAAHFPICFFAVRVCVCALYMVRVSSGSCVFDTVVFLWMLNFYVCHLSFYSSSHSHSVYLCIFLTLLFILYVFESCVRATVYVHSICKTVSCYIFTKISGSSSVSQTNHWMKHTSFPSTLCVCVLFY